MKRRKGLSVVHKPGKDSKKRDEEKSLQDLAASLRARRSEALETSGIGEVLWTECVEVARKEFVKGAELKKKRKEEFLAALKCSVMKTFFLFCNYGLKGLGILCIALLCIGLFLYLCKPASFFLQRKLHSRIYPVSRLARKCLLTLNPYLSTVGIDLFSSCVVRNPLVSDDWQCPTTQDIKEWTRNGSTVPIHIIEAVKSGEWWILHDALHIDAEVTVQRLHQFSVDKSGILPQTCAEIVDGREGSVVTVFYTDIFDIVKMKEALKSPVPWSLSWIECPDEGNPLTIHSLLPSLSHLPPGVETSSMTLFSLSTEWCVSYHYQGELPSTLLSLLVVKGEVRVVPVEVEEDCQEDVRGFWENPILLKEGDSVLLDHRYWSYEVQTWSNYSITITSSLLPTSEHGY